MRTIVITNDKGGVAKTTTVANLAVGLVREGYKILVVDMDLQGDVTDIILGARPPLLSEKEIVPKTAYTLMLERHKLTEVMLEAPRYPNLFIVPSNKDLSQASAQLANKPGSQTVLRHILQTTPNSYDYVVIDTGRGLDLLVINSLAAADDVIIMTTPGKLELDAVERMHAIVEEVRTRTLLGAKTPQVLGIVLAKADHYSIAQDTKTFLKKRYPGKVFKTVVPKNDDLGKALARSLSVFEFNPRSKGAIAYNQLLKEILWQQNLKKLV